MFFLFKSLGFSLANIGLVWAYHDHTLHRVHLTCNVAVMALQSHGSEDLFCCSNHSSPISEAISTNCTSAFPMRAGWKWHRVSLEYLLRAFMTTGQVSAYIATRTMENWDNCTDSLTNQGFYLWKFSVMNTTWRWVALSFAKCTHFNFDIKNKIKCNLQINFPPNMPSY